MSVLSICPHLNHHFTAILSTQNPTDTRDIFLKVDQFSTLSILSETQQYNYNWTHTISSSPRRLLDCLCKYVFSKTNLIYN